MQPHSFALTHTPSLMTMSLEGHTQFSVSGKLHCSGAPGLAHVGLQADAVSANTMLLGQTKPAMGTSNNVVSTWAIDSITN